MLKRMLRYGLIAGLIVGVTLFATTVALRDNPPPMAIGALIGYLTMLIAFSAIFVAVKGYRDEERGGVVGFAPAFGLGLAISAIAGVCYVLAWEAALAVTGMDFAGSYARALLDEKKASGAGPEVLAAFAAEMDRFKADYARPGYRLLMTFTEIFPVGVLVSLVTAGLLRNPRFMPAQRPA